MEQRQNAIFRFSIVFLLITAGFLVVLGYIIHLQWFEKEELMQTVSTGQSIERVITPQRGNILDSEGRLLASSIPG